MSLLLLFIIIITIIIIVACTCSVCWIRELGTKFCWWSCIQEANQKSLTRMGTSC